MYVCMYVCIYNIYKYRYIVMYHKTVLYLF